MTTKQARTETMLRETPVKVEQGEGQPARLESGARRSDVDCVRQTCLLFAQVSPRAPLQVTQHCVLKALRAHLGLACVRVRAVIAHDPHSRRHDQTIQQEPNEIPVNEHSDEPPPLIYIKPGSRFRNIIFCCDVCYFRKLHLYSPQEIKWHRDLAFAHTS